jgi:ATP-dependent DNA ligase
MPPSFPIAPPVEPMLSKVAEEIPRADGFLFEPKWDGFRAIVYRGGGDDVYIQSRDLKPLDRYFPELHDGLVRTLPDGCVVDGEIVIATPHGLDFDLLQMRLHPAASRAAKLSKETPASFVAFDVLAAGGRDVRGRPFDERRERLEQLLANAGAPTHLTPTTRDRDVAVEWLARFEGAGLDGVIAKPAAGTYEPNKRVMLKIKHERECDCVVAGFRWHKKGAHTAVGSLLLGLYNDSGALQHVGVCASFTDKKRRELVEFLAPYRENSLADHPWQQWAEQACDADAQQRMPGGQSRWSGGKDLSWEPLRPELVVEVAYDHMQGNRFRHTAQFRRWRTDKKPADCTYAQLEVVLPEELATIFAGDR